MISVGQRRRTAAVVGLACAAALGFALFDGTAAAASPVGSIRNAGSPEAIKDRYIVVLKDGVPESRRVARAAHDLANRYTGSVQQTFDATLHGFTIRMTAERAKHLAANPAVKYVQQDRSVRLLGTQTGPPSWGLDRIDQPNLPLSQSYTYATVASTVHAYVIDTGVRITHQDFGGRASYGVDEVHLLPGRTCTSNGAADDWMGHGTHVAGIIGGTTFGVAKQVQLVAVRVLDCTGSGSYGDIVAGIDWVTHNAVRPAVANMSLGGPADSTLDDAVRASIASGVTYAVAAGNGDEYGHPVNACTQSPADTAEAITVAATDIHDVRASWSNTGPCVDLFAPGVDIVSAYGTGDTAAAYMSGTSMATPHVAGAAALVLAANPGFTPGQVASTLVGRAATDRVTGICGANATANRLLYLGDAPAGPGPSPVSSVCAPPPLAPVPAPTPCWHPTSGSDVRIPDRGTAYATITVGGCSGRASRNTSVEVHIRDGRRGDYAIDLIAPNGRTQRLKNTSPRDNARGLDAVYHANMSSANRNGRWRLRIRDLTRRNTGVLDSWTLTL